MKINNDRYTIQGNSPTSVLLPPNTLYDRGAYLDNFICSSQAKTEKNDGK